MKPHFLVVGAAKAGTTWLHYCLDAHPKIFVPKAKELHFFSYPYVYQRGKDWYESFFHSASSESVLGEVCPSYISFPNVAERIYKYNPNMKLIFVLRDPVQRAYSHYCMGMKIGRVSLDINQNLSNDSPYVQLGLYYQQITRFKKVFPSEQIKIIIFDDIKVCPHQTLTEIYTFLQVNKDFVPTQTVLNPKNVSKSLPKYSKIYKLAKGIEQKLSNNSKVFKEVFTEFRLKGYLDIFHQINCGNKYPQLSKEKKKSLAEFYSQDVDNLSQLLNKDLQFWLKPYLQ